MPSAIDKKGPAAPAAPMTPLDSASGLPVPSPAAGIAAPGPGLSGAFVSALGGKKAAPPPGAGSPFTAGDIARQARSMLPGAPTKAPRKPHIGPRSGHK